MTNEYLLEWFDSRINHATFLTREAKLLKGKQRKLLKRCASNVLLRTLAELMQHPALCRSS